MCNVCEKINIQHRKKRNETRKKLIILAIFLPSQTESINKKKEKEISFHHQHHHHNNDNDDGDVNSHCDYD